MATLSFDPLPVLCEGDESLSLRRLLILRGCCLRENELWAVCRECCHALLRIHESPDMFQTLSVTPDTLAFDSSANACFLHTENEADYNYLAPEYDVTGSSFRGHMFSLGMTLLFAAQYNVTSLRSLCLSAQMNSLLRQMTSEDCDLRATVKYVVNVCDRMLTATSSAHICLALVNSAELDSSREGEDLVPRSTTPTSTTRRHPSPTDTLTPQPKDAKFQSRDRCRSPDVDWYQVGNTRISPVPVTCSRDHESSDGDEEVRLPAVSPLIDQPSHQTNRDPINEPCRVGPLSSRLDPEHSSCRSLHTDSPPPDNSANVTQGKCPEDDKDSRRVTDVRRSLIGRSSPLNPKPPGLGPGKHWRAASRQELKPRRHNNELGAYFLPNSQNHELCLSPCNTGPLRNSPPGDKGRTYTAGNRQEARSPTRTTLGWTELGRTDQTESRSQQGPVIGLPAEDSLSIDGQRLADGIGICGREKLTPETDGKLTPYLCEKFTLEVDRLTLAPAENLTSVEGKGKICDVGEKLTSEVDEGKVCDVGEKLTSEVDRGKFCDVGGKLTLDLDSITSQDVSEKFADFSDNRPDCRELNSDRSLTLRDTFPAAFQSLSLSEEELDLDEELASYQRTKDVIDSAMASNTKQWSLRFVYENLGCSLHEEELWALCAQCLITLQDSVDLPALISPLTVTIDNSGQVVFRELDDSSSQQPEYIAPETQPRDSPTEKTCAFGLGAALWTAADYNTPDDQEPALSLAMENLLVAMTQDNPDLRPGFTEILESCQNNIKVDTTAPICRDFVKEALASSEFGRQNTRERRLASPAPYTRVHRTLMQQINSHAHRLRKTSKPKVAPVQEIFYSNPNLMKQLKHITNRLNARPPAPVASSGGTTGASPHLSSARTNQEPLQAPSKMAAQFKPGDGPLTRVSDCYNNLVKKLEELKKRKGPRVNDIDQAALETSRESHVTKTSKLKGTSREGQTNTTPPCDSSVGTRLQTSSLTSPIERLEPAAHVSLPTTTGALPPNLIVQLQQDPHTGLYSLIPVALPSNPILTSPTSSSSDRSSVHPSAPGPPIQHDCGKERIYDTQSLRDHQLASDSGVSRSKDPPLHFQGEAVSIRRSRSMEWSYDGNNSNTQLRHNIHSQPDDPAQKLRRSRSGSTLDYNQNAPEVRAYDVYDDTSSHSLKCSIWSKSQPSLGGAFEEWYVRDRNSRRDVYSPSDVSPSTSPPLSRDSGVGGLRLDRSYPTGSLRRQSILGAVKKLIRDEFAFDGYMENGVEDLQMAEYTVGLAGVSLPTFCSAVSEKFVDLFWSEELLANLYDAANGRKPRLEVIEDKQREEDEATISSTHSPITDQQVFNSPITGPSATQRRDCYDEAAFRPISTPKTSKDLNSVRSVFKPKPHRLSSSEADQFTDTNSTNIHRSASLHNIQFTGGNFEVNQVTVKALSQGDLTKTSQITVPTKEMVIGKESRTIQVIDLSTSAAQNKDGSKSSPDFSTKLVIVNGAEGKDETLSIANSPGLPVRADSATLSEHSHISERSYETDTVSRGMSPQLSLLSQRNSPAATHSLRGDSPAASSVSDWPGNTSDNQWPGAESNKWRDVDEGEYYDSDVLDSYAKDYDDDEIPSDWLRSDARSPASDDTRSNDTASNSPGWPHTGHHNGDTPSNNHNDHGPRPSFHPRHHEIISSSSSKSSTLADSSQSSSRAESSQSSKMSDTPSRLKNVASSSTDDVTADVVADTSWQRLLGSDIAYYWTEANINTTPYILDMIAKMDISSQEDIEKRMCEVDQERCVEERNKRRTFKYYRRLMDVAKSNKASGEQKNQKSKVMHQLSEIKEKLDRLLVARRHLELVYADNWGVDLSLLASLSVCLPDQPMLLSPMPHTSILHLHTSRDPCTSDEIQAIHAGTPQGLLAHLFLKGSFANGYIHQFFYCYRYFTTPFDLLTFIIDKVNASTLSLSPDSGAPSKVKVRGLDLIQVWIEGYYGVDFQSNTKLLDTLSTFLNTLVVNDSSAKSLLDTLDQCDAGQRSDFCSLPSSDVSRSIVCDITLDEKRWESFKLSMKLPPTTHKPLSSVPLYSTTKTSCLKNAPSDVYGSDDYHPRVGSRLTDDFSISDFTALSLAEQLTLMQQEYFHQSHPVLFLNSRARGISVQLTHPVLSRSHSLALINSAQDSQSGCGSLFIEPDYYDNSMHNLVELSHSIALWVSSEILSCPSAKMQIAVTIKFISTAKHCRMHRNYATSVSLIDGLENLLVRQLPIWKHIPAKSVATLEELSKFKQNLKSDAMYYSKEIHWGSVPTIPCILYFLLHVQQLEIGSFTLVNGMYKWTKMKTITQQADQIRVCQQRSYRFTADAQSQTLIRNRINELSQNDLQMLASQNIHNFPKMSSSSSSSGLSATFRRFRHRFQRKSNGST